MNLRTPLCALLCLILASCPGNEEVVPSTTNAPAEPDRSEQQWIPAPGTFEGLAEKYAKQSKEEMQLAFDALQDALNLEKKAELERLHEEGRIVRADNDGAGKPIWPKSIPRDCFFQSRTRHQKGRPLSEMEAWFVYLPFEEFPHLYEMREELRWLKKTLHPGGKKPVKKGE